MCLNSMRKSFYYDMIKKIDLTKKDPIKTNAGSGIYQTTVCNSNTAVVIKEVNKIEINGRLYEEIYNPQTQVAKFVYYDKQAKTINEVPYVYNGNIRYIPLVDNFLKKQAVILPTQAILYQSEEKLLEEIQSFIHKYLDIPEEDEKICTWIVPTFWLFDKLNIMIPYLRALGDTGCGKSRLLDVVGGISYRSTPTGGSMTPAVLYRVAEKWKGTMIIDEADWRDTDEYSEVIKIINCNQPGRKIFRCNGDNYDDIDVFDPWSPRIFGTRRIFNDAATESRMFTIQMKETSRQDIPIALNDEFYKTQKELTNKLLTYRLMNWDRVNSSIQLPIDLSGIEPRSKQIMYPLAIVFNHKKDILQTLIQIMKKRQGELIKERSSTHDGVIVNVFLELLDRGNANITASDLIELLKRKGIEENAQSIGHSMKSLGFSSIVKNIKGETKRCYQWDDTLIEKLRSRYSLKSLRLQAEDEKLQKLQRLQLKNIVGRIANKFKRFGKQK